MEKTNLIFKQVYSKHYDKKLLKFTNIKRPNSKNLKNKIAIKL